MELNLNKYKSWLNFLKKVTCFFEEEGFLEVKTPSLVVSGAMEAHLESFKIKEGYNLPTSPEFSLKKLWLGNDNEFNSIFEISPSFRKEELGELHLAEFTMLEFYKSEKDLDYLKNLIKSFFSFLFKTDFIWGEVCLADLFLAGTGFKLSPDSDKAYLIKVCDFNSLNYSQDYSWNDFYQLIYINLLEPLICKETPVFVKNYPPQIAALAKINGKGWADRIEVFYKGVELGNGYNELFDSKELLNRWNLENEERLAFNKDPHPIDHELVEIHSKTRMNQGVGIAFGLERLFALINKNDEIKVWPF